MTAQSINKSWFQRTTEYLNQVLEIRPAKAEKHMESEYDKSTSKLEGETTLSPIITSGSTLPIFSMSKGMYEN
jgi:hypothetical protein